MKNKLIFLLIPLIFMLSWNAVLDIVPAGILLWDFFYCSIIKIKTLICNLFKLWANLAGSIPIRFFFIWIFGRWDIINVEAMPTLSFQSITLLLWWFLYVTLAENSALLGVLFGKEIENFGQNFKMKVGYLFKYPWFEVWLIFHFILFYK